MSKVDFDQVDKFSKSHEMPSHVGSAKTGDQVNQLFYRIAADLAGVKVTKAQIEAQQSYTAVAAASEQVKNQKVP